MTFSSFRPSFGAWRRQKCDEREALKNYKKMMRDPGASAFSGSKKGEGRSRRRKNWVARKRQAVEAETLVRALPGEIKEVYRRDGGDNYLRLKREEARRLRVEKLSSEKVRKKTINIMTFLTFLSASVS